MTPEERIKQVIGDQAFAISILQSKVDDLSAENAKLKEENAKLSEPKTE